MPQKKPETQKKSEPSLLQRIFGTAPMTPEMLEGIRIAKAENPNLAPVESYGPISRMFRSNAQAYASPGRTIYLNPDQSAGLSPQDIADTLVHEQTHINQMNDRNYSTLREFYSPLFRGTVNTAYAQRPDEMEAFQAEKDRRIRMGRSPAAVPSFTTGNFYVPSDIHLPNEKLKKVYKPTMTPKTMK